MHDRPHEVHTIYFSHYDYMMMSTLKRVEGPNSAEAYWEDILVPALQRHARVRVVINGGAYSMNYLDEIFGGLIRMGYFTYAELDERLEFVAAFGYKYTRLAIVRFMRRATVY
jgi:hypothetical protein